MKDYLAGRARLSFLCFFVAFSGFTGLVVSEDVAAKPNKDGTDRPGKSRGKKWQPTPSTNSPPTISGTPAAEVLENAVYGFTPSARDADGDPLVFSIANKPAWAGFDPATGALWGEPTAADVGRYDGIKISVSDAQATTSLPIFAIDVTAAGLASVTLSWQAPTQNTDGTALTDLAGYKIYYGLDPQNFSNVIDIPTAGVTTYVVENLTPDTWYFAATALNGSGTESDFSSTITRDTR